MVPLGARAADICADHCLLAIHLVQSGRSPFVIAIDVAATPLAQGNKRVRLAGFNDAIDTRQADGFEGLHARDAAAVAIAGIGGREMVKMLQRGTPKTRGVRWLILQANKDVDQVRQWLCDNGWNIEQEQLVHERGRWFPVIRAMHDGAVRTLTRGEALLGPKLLARGGQAFDAFVAHTLSYKTREANGQRKAGLNPAPAQVAIDAITAATTASRGPMPVSNAAEIRRIAPRETAPLRQAILRPNLTLDALVYPGDDDPLSAHFGAFIDGEMVGIASVYCMGIDGTVGGGAWRLRGMGVLPNLHRSGIGAALMDATFSHARSHGGTRYWCNARVVAQSFYEALGLRIEGEEFDVPGVGPHYVMARSL